MPSRDPGGSRPVRMSRWISAAARSLSVSADDASADLASARAGMRQPHFRISFARSTLFCISFCCFITSTHQARSLVFSSGLE